MIDAKGLDIVSERSLAIKSWTGALAEKYSQIDPSILAMTELELTDHFKPFPLDYFIRKRFWEMTKAHDPESGQLEITRLYDDLCSSSTFYDRILKNPYILSWILIPLEVHMDMFEEFFYTLLAKMRKEMVNLSLNDKTLGQFNKTLEYLANRVLGPVTQKIEQRSLNVTVDGNQAMKDVTNAEELDDKFKELKSKLKALPATVKNVEEPE